MIASIVLEKKKNIIPTKKMIERQKALADTHYTPTNYAFIPNNRTRMMPKMGGDGKFTIDDDFPSLALNGKSYCV